MSFNRVTFGSSMLLIRNNLFTVQKQYEEAAIPATTGRKINNLSDNSSILSRLFSLRNESFSNEQYQRNISEASRRINFTEAQLTGANDMLQNVRELALQASDPTIKASMLSQLADQIEEYKEQFLIFANARQDGKYIFSGSATSTQPFQDSGGGIIAFNGNTNTINIQVNSSKNIPLTFDSNEYFMGNVDTAVGATLATALKSSDGVNLGVLSGDTITLAGTVGATPFSTTLSVTGATTLTNIASSLQVALRAAGDNTETAVVQVDGSIRVTSGAGAITGLTLSIPSNTVFNTAFTFPTPIAAAGGTGDSDDFLTGTGEDIFDVLNDIKDAVSAGNSDDIETHLTRLDSSVDQILNARSLMSIRQQQIDLVESNIAETSLRTLEDLSNIEDANIDEVLSNLVIRETALRTIFATSAKILSTTSSLQLGG